MFKFYPGRCIRESVNSIKLSRLIQIFLLILITLTNSWSDDIDDLEERLKKTTNRKKQVEILNTLVISYGFNDSINYLRCAKRAETLAEQIEFDDGYALSQMHIGNFYNYQYLYDTALNHFNIALSIYREKVDDQKIAETLYKIGTVFFSASNYKAALQYTNEALESFMIIGDIPNRANTHSLICEIESHMGFNARAIEHCRNAKILYEQIGKTDGKPELLNSMGSIYLDLQYYRRCENSFNQAIYLAKSINNEGSIPISLSGLGHLYVATQDYEESFKYYTRALEIDSANNNLAGLGYSNFNIGTVLKLMGKYTDSFFYLSRSLRYSEQLYDLELQAKGHSEIGNLYSQMGDYEKAIEHLKVSVVVAQKIGSDPILETCYNNLAKYYDQLNEKENALIYFKLYMIHKEEMYANQSSSKIAEAEALYNLENKEKQIQLLRRENQIKDLEANERALMNIWLLSGLIFILTVTMVVYRQYKIQNNTNKVLQDQKSSINQQKDEIQTQKESIDKINQILTDKNRQITDSIEYAKKIQVSLLPDEKVLRNNFQDSFIWYLPKDIVSGDFYWFAESENSLCIGVIDCTGHGVPGGFMTVLGNSLLNQYALEHKDLNSPKEILEYMDRNVRTRLNQHGIQLSSPEGMDMSMTIIDFKSLNLKFSSARLPLYISHGENFDQLVGDRLSIGGDEILDKKFTEKSIKVKKGDVLYMSTDGFQDQFGGKDDKKFMKLHFRNLLASMNGLSMENQKIKLVNTFNDWKEFNLQTDDILILGIRI